MKVTVFKEFTFDSAHRLDGHEGLCSNLHGHTYKLQVGVSNTIIDSPDDSDDGMVCDFKDLKALVKNKIIDKLDHQFLNDVLDFRTTVENMATWILNELIDARLPVTIIRLWETPTSFCEVANE